MKKIAITGIGIVAPSGMDKKVFWANIKAGRSEIKVIDRYDTKLYPSHIGGQIHQLDAYSHISSRLLQKIDPFSHMALIASEMALKDAGIDLAAENLNNIGIFMGNALGGWLYGETELRDLYIEGREGVSPYMASAWFPAAPQGQVSIYYGIKGYSKTVVSDRASSLMAIGYGAKVLARGKVDFILAGGMEAPLSPYGLLCCNTNGDLSTDNDHPESAYKPFDKKRGGFVVGEGAGIMIFEPQERVGARGREPYGYVTGYGTTCDGTDRIKANPDGKELARAIRMALDDAGYKPQDIDYVSLDGAATMEGDVSEVAALKEVFGDRVRHIPVSAPKTMFGNLLGASGAVDMIITLLAMEHGLIPPTLNLKDVDPGCQGLDYVIDKARPADIRRALVISRGRAGINAVVALEKP
ncbi:MAG: beta-ketoacyl-[acyl-carrier-protein] synthase family protein [Candidatus Omnitrophica bacterium]|nr:beta-ketoacyl-[acyl-carrier-protein] synthase family protein [Candidatus Omnitrophota bacterium]MDD5574919.1 beta-ketoacyl-[acyl-carrier-protein] synthase family protein [Candidatus Omnitrophota bacterium]